MGTHQFDVDGPLKGFIVHERPWSQKAKDYCAYKARVRLLANLAGVPDEIPAGHRASFHVDVTWRLKARLDCSNVLKALEDGVFRRDRGIGEIHVFSRQYGGEEKAVVTIRLERETACGRSSTQKSPRAKSTPSSDSPPSPSGP